MPDTLDYLILGMTIGLGTIGLYVGLLVVRFNNVRRDIQTIEQLAEDE